MKIKIIHTLESLPCLLEKLMNVSTNTFRKGKRHSERIQVKRLTATSYVIEGGFHFKQMYPSNSEALLDGFVLENEVFSLVNLRSRETDRKCYF